MKARNVPLALKPKIEDALKELLSEGIIEPIDNPKWGTLVVPVLKPNGKVRLCGDYKITVNKAMQAHPHPTPAVNNLLSSLEGGGFGAFRVNRLQFRINVAPGIFQNTIEDLFSGLEGVVPYFDDVLIRAV